MSTSKYDIKHAEQSTLAAVSQNNVYTKTVRLSIIDLWQLPIFHSFAR